MRSLWNFRRFQAGDMGLDLQGQDRLVLFKGRIYVLQNSPSIPTVVSTYHDSAHEGIHKTLH